MDHPESTGPRKPFDDVGGALSMDFVNTASARAVGPLKEQLGSYDDLLRWAEQFQVIDSGLSGDLRAQAAANPGKAESTLGIAQRLREAIYSVFHARTAEAEVPRADLDELNRAYARAAANRKLIVDEQGVHFGWPAAESLERPLWPVAVDAAELLVSEDAARVKECGSENCNWLFVDVSRNRSRRWCEMRECGNRMKARRHYQRRKTA